MHDGNFSERASVGHEETRRKIVRCVDHDGRSSHQLDNRVGRCATVNRLDGELWGAPLDCSLERLELGASEVVVVEQDLPVQIGKLDHIVVDDDHRRDARLGERQSGWRADAARSNEEHGSLLQSNDTSRVTRHALGSDHRFVVPSPSKRVNTARRRSKPARASEGPSTSTADGASVARGRMSVAPNAAMSWERVLLEAGAMNLPRPTILVPVDFGPLSAEALDVAARLASPLRASLVLLHVHSPRVLSYPDLPPGLAQRTYDALVESARLSLAKLAVDSGAAGASLRIGDPAEEVLAAIDEVAPLFVVMGTHGRRGLQRLALGSVAEAVVRRSSRPVITVRSIARAAA